MFQCGIFLLAVVQIASAVESTDDQPMNCQQTKNARCRTVQKQNNRYYWCTLIKTINFKHDGTEPITVWKVQIIVTQRNDKILPAVCIVCNHWQLANNKKLSNLCVFFVLASDILSQRGLLRQLFQDYFLTNKQEISL